MKQIFIFSAIILVANISGFSQEKSTRQKYKYTIVKVVAPIKIDGIESDNEWNNYPLIQEMYKHNPTDEGLAVNRTEIRLSYDDDMLYIMAKLFDNGTRVIQSLDRDSDDAHLRSDSFTVVLDPINEKQSGFIFGVNAGGSEMEGSLIVEPTQTNYTLTWDERWFSSTKQYEDYWLTEIAIPFTSLRYNEENFEWGMNFVRIDKAENFAYTWTQFPLNFTSLDVNYMGTLQWQSIPKVRNKTAFIKPYTTLSSLKDNQKVITDADTKIDAGIDIKMAVTKSLSADITFNPDFSNADVDEEVTNISRFNISLPERREFFTENADIFSNFGSYSISPFFSRRIGLQNGKSVPIIYGARLTGNITDNLRIGAMNVQTKQVNEIEAQNHTVAAFNYKLFGRSQLKGLFINRVQTSNDLIKDYTRNFGGEFIYVSKKGNFNSNVKFHKSVTEENLNGSYFGFKGDYITRTFGGGWNIDVVNKNYEADLGFTPRLFNYNAETGETIRQTFTQINPWVRYRIFNKKEKSKIIGHTFWSWHDFYLDGDSKTEERAHNIAYSITFKSTSEIYFSANNREVNLNFPTNFLGSNFDNIPTTTYNFWSTNFRYRSDNRKRFTYNGSISAGEFFNGNIATLSASGNMRFGYWGNFNLSYTYNDINLPENYGEVNIHLIKLKALFSFTNKLFFNNMVQYNSQSENFSVFSKLQWRYSPLSDIFLIYNQNNSTEEFDLRNRSIILKITHRFSI